MVSSAVLGAAAGPGLALVVALTLVIYRYYNHRRKGKDWGDLERFDSPYAHSSGRQGYQGSLYNPTKYVRKNQMTRWDSRGSRSSTKSCPPLYTYPQQVRLLYNLYFIIIITESVGRKC